MSSLQFNADEVFEIAKRIERNGRAYYLAAAEVMQDPTQKKMMNDLADMEAAHEKIFASMQKELGGSEIEEPLYDPHKEAYQFLVLMADRYVFNPEAAPEEILSDGMEPEAILRGAIEREKDSIIFYEGIKVMVPHKYGGDRVDEIIAQEMGHILVLNRELAKVTA